MGDVEAYAARKLEEALREYLGSEKVQGSQDHDSRDTVRILMPVAEAKQLCKALEIRTRVELQEQDERDGTAEAEAATERYADQDEPPFG